MNLIHIASDPRFPLAVMTAGAGAVFGLDFTDPQTVNSLLGGGLAVIALFIMWRLLSKSMSHNAQGEKNEGEMIGVMKTLVTDVTSALENNNRALASLTEVIENDRAETRQTINGFTERLESVERTVDEVHTKVATIETIVNSDN